MKMLIVVDSVHPLYRNNECFDPKYEYSGCGHSLLVRLAREAKNREIEVVTADLYLKMKETPIYTGFFADMLTPLTSSVLAKGAHPMICMSLESPIIAKKFYHRIVHYAGNFQHNFQFRGTYQRLIKSGTIFHPVIFPMESNIQQKLISWEHRNYLTLVNSNKRATSKKWNNLISIFKTIVYGLYIFALKLIDPWMRSKEIYKDRIEAIYYFSNHSNFKLYGIGWDQPISGYGMKYHNAAIKVWAGTLEYKRKREIMGKFKFVLCFENCVFPGYISEKIFDCFLAGSIPVYYGAPDIEDFIPENTFIDFRKFKNYNDLDQYLRKISKSDALVYLNAARDFLKSDAFNKFKVDHIVNEILEITENNYKLKTL